MHFLLEKGEFSIAMFLYIMLIFTHTKRSSYWLTQKEILPDIETPFENWMPFGPWACLRRKLPTGWEGTTSPRGTCHPWTFRTDLWWSLNRSWKKKRKNQLKDWVWVCFLLALWDGFRRLSAKSTEIIESRVDSWWFQSKWIQSSNRNKHQTVHEKAKFLLSVTWKYRVSRLEFDNATILLVEINHPSKGRSSWRSETFHHGDRRQPTPTPEIELYIQDLLQ